MQSYTPDRVINGTFGEVTIGDDYMAEVTGLEAKVTLEKTEVNQTGSLGKGYKVTGIDGKGVRTGQTHGAQVREHDDEKTHGPTSSWRATECRATLELWPRRPQMGISTRSRIHAWPILPFPSSSSAFLIHAGS